MKKLQSINNRTTVSIEHLQNEIEARHNYFDGRSEKWQDSQTGIEYEAITEEIEEVYELLVSASEIMDQILEQ